MTMNRVRPAAKNDYRVLLGLEQQLLAVHASALPGDFHPDGSDWSERSFARLISHPWSTVLVAEVDGVPAGYAVVRLEPATLADQVMVRLPASLLPITQFVPRLWSKLRRGRRGLMVNRRVAFIDSFVVGKEFRRQRIAKSLWDACVQWSLDRGAEELQFEAFEFNHAVLSFIDYLGIKPFKHRYLKHLSAGDQARADQRT
jgi:GNAT superfamily N-acetyltransferase